MMSTKKMICVVAVAGVLATRSTGAVFAEELSTIKFMKPIHGISFYVGGLPPITVPVAR